MGAWIETLMQKMWLLLVEVAPFVGAWIETAAPRRMDGASRSLPSWERGLKHAENHVAMDGGEVAPFVGAWIET